MLDLVTGEHAGMLPGIILYSSDKKCTTHTKMGSKKLEIYLGEGSFTSTKHKRHALQINWLLLNSSH